jgi:hypothetical protein
MSDAKHTPGPYITTLIDWAIEMAAAGVHPLCAWEVEEEDGKAVLVAPFGAKVYFDRHGDAYTEVFAAMSDASFQTASAKPGWTVTAAQITCEMNARELLMSPAEKAGPQLLVALVQVERWCADVVIEPGAWANGGSRPMLTQEQCDRFAELQGVIAKALAAAKGEGWP